MFRIFSAVAISLALASFVFAQGKSSGKMMHKKAELSGKRMIFSDPFAHVAGDDHFHWNIIEHDIAGKNRQKPPKVDDIDRIVRS